MGTLKRTSASAQRAASPSARYIHAHRVEEACCCRFPCQRNTGRSTQHASVPVHALSPSACPCILVHVVQAHVPLSPAAHAAHAAATGRCANAECMHVCASTGTATCDVHAHPSQSACTHMTQGPPTRCVPMVLGIGRPRCCCCSGRSHTWASCDDSLAHVRGCCMRLCAWRMLPARWMWQTM